MHPLRQHRRGTERKGPRNLAKTEQTIGDLDAQIAGHALSLNARLATKNRKHFQRVEGLKLLE